MKRPVWAIIIAGALVVPAVAQDVFSHPLTERTRKEVTAITERMASRTVIKAAFQQTKTVSRLKRSFVSTGRMIFSADRGLLWEVETPVAGATVMAQDRIAQKNSSGRISILSSSGNDTFRRFAAIMQAVFSGDHETIEKEFDVFFRNTGKGHWEIGLVPKDRTVKNAIAALEIRGGADVEGFTLNEPGGDRVDYALSAVTYPPALSPDDEKAFF